uniref:acyl-CoA dehydrogenase family protein n=1 Tax=Streptomyces galilaeus TaxID=33899 RepID=UPI0038F6022E
RCLDEAVGYVKQRSQFGQPIAAFQNTQFTLADMATDLEAARALLYLAAAKSAPMRPTRRGFRRWPRSLPPTTARRSSIV